MHTRCSVVVARQISSVRAWREGVNAPALTAQLHICCIKVIPSVPFPYFAFVRELTWTNLPACLQLLRRAGGAPAKKKFISREEEPEQYWTSKGEADGTNPMKVGCVPAMYQSGRACLSPRCPAENDLQVGWQCAAVSPGHWKANLCSCLVRPLSTAPHMCPAGSYWPACDRFFLAGPSLTLRSLPPCNASHAQDPLAIIGVLAIFFPFIFLAVAVGAGLIDLSVYR